MEKLYALLQERRYDLIVLDTPPTVHALDFLDAPGRLEEFMTLGDDGLAAKGGRALGRLGLGFLRANTAILKGAGKFLGADVFTDILSFIGDFQTMYAGFRDRAAAVKRFMRSDEIAFLVITGPERASIDEGLFLRERLVADRMPFASFLVNRTRLPVDDAGPLEDETPEVLAALRHAAERMGVLAARDARELARLDKALGHQALRIPESADDICALRDLHRYAGTVLA